MSAPSVVSSSDTAEATRMHEDVLLHRYSMMGVGVRLYLYKDVPSFRGGARGPEDWPGLSTILAWTGNRWRGSARTLPTSLLTANSAQQATGSFPFPLKTGLDNPDNLIRERGETRWAAGANRIEISDLLDDPRRLCRGQGPVQSGAATEDGPWDSGLGPCMVPAAIRVPRGPRLVERAPSPAKSPRRRPGARLRCKDGPPRPRPDTPAIQSRVHAATVPVDRGDFPRCRGQRQVPPNRC